MEVATTRMSAIRYLEGYIGALQLVVIGSRNADRVMDLVGPHTLSILAHADCSVLVAREPDPLNGFSSTTIGVRVETDKNRLMTDPQPANATALKSGPLSQEQLRLIDAYWRAANYLSVGQIYLWTTLCCVSRWDQSTSSRGCWVTGAPRRA